MYLIYNIFAITVLIKICSASGGDSSTFYFNCLTKCESENCEDDRVSFINHDRQPFHLELMQWGCSDECQYDCMWNTVDAFHRRKWTTPQFYGKWPFIRFLGIQEPASVLFSLMNLYAHIRSLTQFRKDVRPDSPMAWMWHLFSIVCMHAWVWSAIFHSRDLPFTEFMDYSCAFSMIMMGCYTMSMRLLKDVPRFIKIIITVLSIAFYANHVAYLRLGRFNYTYNMQVNVLMGCFTAICWLAWSLYNRVQRPYVWKIALFVSLCLVTMSLELIDRPPLFYTIDAHALWHLTTSPLPFLFFSFARDDCKQLRKEQVADDNKVSKQA